MSCDTWQGKIDTYIDAELPDAEVRELEAHMRECPACSSQALSRSQLKRNVHLAGKPFTADPEFRKRVQGSIRPKAVNRGWIWAVAGAACAALLAVVVISALWTQRAQRQQVIGELTDLHVTTLASSNRVDVVSTDRHTVKPWFQGKLPFTFNLPELQGSPFELLGGKMTYLGQDPGAELLFSVRKHVLSVFVFKDTPEVSRALGSGEPKHNLSFNLESWSTGGVRYVIITDASREDVDDLRARFQQAAQ
jgi:anti-sigma factor RsiW